MTVHRFTPEQVKRNQEKREREREQQARERARWGPRPLELESTQQADGTRPARHPDPYGAAFGLPQEVPKPPKPSPAFKKALADVREVVGGYMAPAARFGAAGNRLGRAFVLRLHVPPSVNHNTQPTMSGGRILTPDYRAFRAEVVAAVYDAKLPKLYGRLRVYIRLNCAGDIDNRVKPTLDALQRAGAIENDRLVDSLTIERAPAMPIGTLEVEVAEL